MKFLKIYSPVWANSEQSAIDVTIDTEANGTIIFTAKPDDSTDYGPVIYQRALDGEFGEIAPYSPQDISDADILRPVDYQAKLGQLKAEAESAIKILERAVRHGIATDEERKSLAEWEKYSVLLSRVKPEDLPETGLPEKPANVA